MAPRYIVHPIETDEGKAALDSRNLTLQDLTTAVDAFHRDGGSRIRTWIGVNNDGFFGSTKKDWNPNRPDAFSKPLIVIPWVQVFEYLGRVPEGTTGEFLNSKSRIQ